MDVPQQNHILVGLGGTGGKVLKAFKKRLFQEFTPEERAKLPIGFLYVDTTDEMMHPGDKSWYVRGENAQFNENEFLFIKGISLDEIFASPSSYPGLKGVVGDPEVMRKSIGTLGVAAGQMRRAGRILFGANVSMYLASLGNAYMKVSKISKASSTCIYIFGGLAGGTGSGSIVDVVAQTRMFPSFKEEYQSNGDKATGTSIVAYVMIPETYLPDGYDAGKYHANGYAALKELNALLCKAWKPYDVTGMSPSGRLEFDGVRRIADGLMIYSNENENGVIFDSHKELPQAVADFAYTKIFWECGDCYFNRRMSYEYEDVPGLVEMYENAESGAPVPYRTKTVGSFGIKRVIYPEDEIKDFMAYSAGRQILLRLLYNNWNDAVGFLNAPANVDWADYIKGQDKKLGNPLESWGFSDKHLMLDVPVLPSDEGKWGTFQAYWVKVAPKWLEEAENTSQPIDKLNELCAKDLQTGFRGIGVSDFFSGKKEAREKHAEEIVQRIEADLFDKWVNGTSLYNLLGLMDAIFSETQYKIKRFEERAAELRRLLDGLELDRQAKAKEYNDAGFITRWLKGRRKLAGYAEIMREICLRRTEAEACGFAVDLLKVLLGKENALRCHLEDIIYMLRNAIDSCDRRLDRLCRDDEETDNMDRLVVRCYDPRKVRIFTTNEIILDKKNQNAVYAAVRPYFMIHIGTEKTFARANAAIDQDVINNMVETTVREEVISIHDNTLIEDREKLINRNILEQLSENYSSAEDIHRLAGKIISGSGVLAGFNPDEVGRNVPNNPVTEVGITVMRRYMFVSIPKVECDENVRVFAKELKTAFEKAEDASVRVEVDMSGERNDEIRVLNVADYFPLRCLQNLAYYKEKYDLLTTVTPTMCESEALRNKIILFGEGVGGEGLPDLFVAQEE